MDCAIPIDSTDSTPPDPLAQIVVVLHRPQMVVNIGATVRAMKNMGVCQLRLVQPVAYTPEQISALAHRSADLLHATRHYPDLASAIGDAVYVVGTSARQHRDYPVQPDLRRAAHTLLQAAQRGLVALVFGAEDNGLQRAELDLCQQVLHIPTDPAYSSLNLAQAVLLVLYELRMAAVGLPPPAPAAPVLPVPPVPIAAELSDLEQAWTVALTELDFFETRNPAIPLRRLRRLLHRAQPDRREVAMLRAIAHSIARRLRERGTGKGDQA